MLQLTENLSLYSGKLESTLLILPGLTIESELCSLKKSRNLKKSQVGLSFVVARKQGDNDRLIGAHRPFVQDF